MILRAPNTELLVSGKPKTYLSSASAASASSFTVESIAGFSTSQYLVVGEIGAERTEILQVHTSTSPSGSTITLAANAAYVHEVGTPVYMVDFNRVQFLRTATNTTSGAGSLVTTAITPDQMETIYEDLTNTTGFGFWRFNNQTSAVNGAYSGGTVASSTNGIPYAGYDIDTANEIFERALSNAGVKVNPRLTYSTLFFFLNDFIALANSFNKRWSEAKVLDAELDTLATGDWQVALPSAIAAANDPSCIISLRISGYPRMDYVDHRTWEKFTTDLRFTTLSAAASTSDTTLSLTNSAAFADSGNVLIEGDTIAYTGNTRSTGTLTGVTGIIAAGHASGSHVFQRQETGVPVIYTVASEGNIRFWPIASSTVNNLILYISYYRSIPRVNDLGDVIYITDITPAIMYVTYRIKKFVSGGSLNLNDEDYQQFVTYFKQTIARDNPGEPRSIRLG